MEIIAATELIQNGFPEKKKSAWADLGCGSGIFTNALAGLLDRGSRIFAVDKANQKIKSPSEGVKIDFIRTDFEKNPLPFDNLDGILMANSLHYIKDQSKFVGKVKASLNPKGRIILVEYDTDQSNQWVPFPLGLDKASVIFKESGFRDVVKIGERKSIYRADKMYACLVT